MSKRLQLSRAKGWRMPPNTVKVDRSTRWGNPFYKHGDGYPMDPGLAVASFRKQLCGSGFFMARIASRGTMTTTIDDVRRELRGKNIACWCALDAPCHADVLIEVANGGTVGASQSEPPSACPTCGDDGVQAIGCPSEYCPMQPQSNSTTTGEQPNASTPAEAPSVPD